MHAVFSTLFVLVFLFFLDMFLLVRIGRVLGWPATLAWLGVTFVVGSSLIGRPNARRGSQVPSPWAFLARHVAGILLMLPGLLSDLLGACLLVPPLRAQMGRWMLKGRPDAAAWSTLFRSVGGAYESKPPPQQTSKSPPAEDPEPSEPPKPPREIRDVEFEMLQEDTTPEDQD